MQMLSAIGGLVNIVKNPVTVGYKNKLMRAGGELFGKEEPIRRGKGIGESNGLYMIRVHYIHA